MITGSDEPKHIWNRSGYARSVENLADSLKPALKRTDIISGKNYRQPSTIP